MLLSIVMIIHGLRGVRDHRVHSYGIAFTGTGTIFLLCLLLVFGVAHGVILAVHDDLGHQDLLAIFSEISMLAYFLSIAIIARNTSRESQGSADPANSRDAKA